MGFWDVVAPAWTNAYREGELQKLQMGQQASALAQSPYFQAWAQQNPDSTLVRAVTHIMGLGAPTLDQPAGGGGAGYNYQAQPALPPPQPGQTGPAQLVVPTPQPGAVQKYGTPPPDLSHPGGVVAGQAPSPPRRLGYTFPPAAAT